MLQIMQEKAWNGLVIWGLLSFAPLPLPWEHAWTSLLEDEKHVKQNRVTPVAVAKTASWPPDMWVNQANLMSLLADLPDMWVI